MHVPVPDYYQLQNQDQSEDRQNESSLHQLPLADGHCPAIFHRPAPSSAMQRNHPCRASVSHFSSIHEWHSQTPALTYPGNASRALPYRKQQMPTSD